MGFASSEVLGGGGPGNPIVNEDSEGRQVMARKMVFLVAVWCLAIGIWSALPGSSAEVSAFDPAACCALGLECEQGAKFCCKPESIGALPCSPEKFGYCQEKCGKDPDPE